MFLPIVCLATGFVSGLKATTPPFISKTWCTRKWGVGAVAREAKDAVANGWRAMKLKLGRPGRWFEPNAGVARDIEVVHAVREAVGPEIKILVDANNGYDGKLSLLETFVRETGPAKTFWMEEMITENVADYQKLKEWRDRWSPETMIVDGEGHRGRNTIYWQLMEGRAAGRHTT